MCNAFSCIVTKDCKVFWKTCIDNHGKIAEMVTPSRKGSEMAKVEIVPEYGHYILALSGKEKWNFFLHEENEIDWFTEKHKKACFIAHKKWVEEIKSKINIKEALNPINPFLIKPPKKITDKHIKLLKEWSSVRTSVRASVNASVRASVRASVGDSVGDSVWDSVWDSVGDLVRASVGDSVGDSVWASVWAYIGSEIFRIEKFHSLAELWKMGLVPIFDGKIWRLYGGKKAKVLYYHL